jgi:pimeloyl-ACP methyl ester carboxylesterase
VSVRTDDAPAAELLSDFLAQSPRWTADPEVPGLEHATIHVPADYANPAWRTLDLAVTRIKAADPARRRGVLLAVNGGPGGADGHGRDFPVKFRETSPLGDVYDLIGFDPRGMGASTRLLAYATVAKTPFDSRPPDSLFASIAEGIRAREEACQRGGGELRPHINTRNTCRDMDLIRAVLGEEKINFVGYAYGTVVGAAYGTLFPERLDRSVLDSCVHPDWTWRELFLKQSEAIRNNVEAWARWVGDRHRTFALGVGAEQVLATVESVAAVLGADAATVPTRTLFDGAVGNQAADRSRWAELAELVRGVRVALDADDVAQAKQLLAPTSTWRPGDVEGDLRDGVLEAITLETYAPLDLEVYYADMRVFREHYPYGYGVLRAQPWVSAFRSYEPLEPAVRAVGGGYPTGLVVQAEGDPFDNYEGGVGMAERLGHRLITVTDSGDHEVYLLGNNPAVNEICTRYLVDGVLPEADVLVAPTVARPDIPADADLAAAAA